MSRASITRRSQIAAIVPAAGLGTRLRPFTRVLPKELLPFGRRTLLDWIAAEVVAVGIRALYLVVSEQKLPLFRAHIQAAPHSRSDDEKVAALWAMLHVSFVVQRTPAGLGDAVKVGAAAAREAGHNAPMVVLLPDELHGEGATLADLISAHDQYGGSVVSAFTVPDTELHRYGVLQVNRRSGNEHPYQVTGAIEKPDSGNAPSKLAIAGRYLLDKQVLDVLETTDSPRHGELQLTDAIAAVAEQGGPVWARPIPVPRVDLGTWEAYEAAVVQRLRRGATKV